MEIKSSQPNRPPELWYEASRIALEIHLSELKAGQCRQRVEARLLRFWESRNVKKGGTDE
ncbi:hypothetical protein Bca101_009339 [Brassica carinata]